jgi:PAS domain S-box-containing protein
VQVELATQRVVAVSRSVLELLKAQPGDVIGCLVSEFVVGEPTGAFPLLAVGRLDGFEASRLLRRRDGVDVPTYVWAHALGARRPARFAVLFVTDENRRPFYQPATANGDIKVIGTVDAEWHIDRVSKDVRTLLGYEPSELIGKSVLAAVHPNDLAELLNGLGHAHSHGFNAVVRVRVRCADGTWLWCRARVAPLAEPTSFAFTLRRLTEESDRGKDRARDLEMLLARIGHDVLAAGVTIPSPGFPTMVDRPELAELSSREWEVLLRLADGLRVPSIAAELGLRPSTVRNHLSSIFTKLNVRSQPELLDFLRAVTKDAPDISVPLVRLPRRSADGTSG